MSLIVCIAWLSLFYICTCIRRQVREQSLFANQLTPITEQGHPCQLCVAQFVVISFIYIKPCFRSWSCFLIEQYIASYMYNCSCGWLLFQLVHCFVSTCSITCSINHWMQRTRLAFYRFFVALCTYECKYIKFDKWYS